MTSLITEKKWIPELRFIIRKYFVKKKKKAKTKCVHFLRNSLIHSASGAQATV